MSLDHFLITNFATPIVGGIKGGMIVSAMDATNTVIPGYTGTVHFTSSDSAAILPADYTFTGGDAGVHTFFATLETPGIQSISITDAVANVTTPLNGINVVAKALGWGLDPFGITPYGSNEAGVGIHVLSAVAIATNEVQVNLSGDVLASSSSGIGDALNPTTWLIQRLDNGEIFTPVEVVQLSPTSFGIFTLEPFGPASVQHQVSSSTLLDQSGNLIVPPRSAKFAGVVDLNTVGNAALLANRRVASTDLANVQSPNNVESLIGGTLLIDASGDYTTVTGVELVKKLILRRLTTRPGGFFHLPAYGIGLKVKEKIPITDLPKLKAEIERQTLLEPEVDTVAATVSQDVSGALTVIVKGTLKPTGEPFFLGPPDTGTIVL
jgi:hypothetical protein